MKLDAGKLRTGVALAGILIFSLFQGGNSSAQTAYSKQHATTASANLVVRLPRGIDARRVARDHGFTVENHIPGTGLYRFGLPHGGQEAEMARRLSKDPRVIYAEPDQLGGITPEQLVGSQQFSIAFADGFKSNGYADQIAYSQVDFVPGQTGAPGTGVGQGTIVALLDTGATFTHPALRGHYLPGINLVDPNSPPLDVPDGLTNLAVGHGTMVAGIIAIIDPSAQILPIRVLNGDGVGSVFNVAWGIYYAINQGAQVINLSLGTNQPSRALFQSVLYAEFSGAVVVASAGNNGEDELHYPASYPGVVGIAALEPGDILASFSNYGASVFADAPGDGITSTYYNGGYATWAGTSFSAPFATGEASLILENHPWLNPFLAELVIWFSSDSIDALNPGFAGLLGAGVLDIADAIRF